MLASQLAVLKNVNAPQTPVAPLSQPAVQYDLTPEEEVEVKKPFGATARIEKQVQGLTEKQQTFLSQLTLRYNNKTGRSKE